jgi:hypothetical protein
VSGETETVGVLTLLEAFLYMSLRSASFIDENFFFLVKSQNFGSDYSPQVLDYQISGL